LPEVQGSPLQSELLAHFLPTPHGPQSMPPQSTSVSLRFWMASLQVAAVHFCSSQ
jgi:hypothetical protein